MKREIFARPKYQAGFVTASLHSCMLNLEGISSHVYQIALYQQTDSLEI